MSPQTKLLWQKIRLTVWCTLSKVQSSYQLGNNRHIYSFPQSLYIASCMIIVLKNYLAVNICMQLGPCKCSTLGIHRTPHVLFLMFISFTLASSVLLDFAGRVWQSVLLVYYHRYWVEDHSHAHAWMIRGRVQLSVKCAAVMCWSSLFPTSSHLRMSCEGSVY